MPGTKTGAAGKQPAVTTERGAGTGRKMPANFKKGRLRAVHVVVKAVNVAVLVVLSPSGQSVHYAYCNLI